MSDNLSIIVLSSKDGNSWLLVSEMKVLLYLYMYYKYYENY